MKNDFVETKMSFEILNPTTSNYSTIDCNHRVTKDVLIKNVGTGSITIDSKFLIEEGNFLSIKSDIGECVRGIYQVKFEDNINGLCHLVFRLII